VRGGSASRARVDARAARLGKRGAARRGLRVSLNRRGTEYIVVARRVTTVGTHEAFIGHLPMTGEDLLFQSQIRQVVAEAYAGIDGGAGRPAAEQLHRAALVRPAGDLADPRVEGAVGAGRAALVVRQRRQLGRVAGRGVVQDVEIVGDAAPATPPQMM